MSNVKAAVGLTAGDMDEEGAVRAALPEDVRRFLDEEAPMPFKPSQVAGFLAANGEAATMSRLREIVAADTKKFYGAGHPALMEE